MLRFVDSGDKAIITISGDLTLKTANKFIHELAQVYDHENEPFVYVVVNSDGGDFRAFYAILDAINHYPLGLYICAMGACGSSAADLVFCVTEHTRFAGPNTEFLIHEAEVSVEKEMRYGNFLRRKKIERKFTDDANKKVLNMLADASQVDHDFICEQITKNQGEWVLSAEEAQQHGFIDSIGVPFLNWEEN